jgi:hypothetical protein
MQSTTCFHEGIANPILPEADLVFHHAVPFYSTNRVFDTDADGRDRTMGRLFPWGEVTAPWLFRGLHHGHPLERHTLTPPILIETTPVGPGRAGPIGQALILGFACTGGAQAAQVTGCVDAQPVFDHVALLLTAVMVLWRLGIGRALERPLGTIMPNRGGRGRALRLYGSEQGGSIVGGAGRTPRVMGSGLVQHGVEEMHPRMGVRLGHPQELSLPLRDGMLCHVGQHAAPCVRPRGPGTMVIRTVAAARAGLPITGAVLQIGHQRGLEMGQPRDEFCFREAGHRS